MMTENNLFIFVAVCAVVFVLVLLSAMMLGW